MKRKNKFKGNYKVTYKTKGGMMKSKIVTDKEMNDALKKLRENKNVELYFYEEVYAKS